jgi:transcriptional regulator with GAF, ATPase, and Fis domain
MDPRETPANTPRHLEAPGEGLSEVARTVHAYARERWGHSQSRRTMLLGRHPAFVTALHRVARFAQSDATVLITGETGTGKELFARALYLLSARRGTAFVSVNCAQYQDGQLSVSELFGHRKGSFTGAVADQPGVFEAADGGVVFLDEIGELPPQGQAILLRTLSEGEIVRLGEARARPVNVRVVAATNRDLKTRWIAASSARTSTSACAALSGDSGDPGARHRLAVAARPLSRRPQYHAGAA